MHSYALLALAAAGYASAQGVAAGTLLPTSSAPAGCSANYASKFEITVVKSTAMVKRDIEKRQSSCSSDGVLVASVAGGVLTDAAGRIGGIVANRQFQFDGPPSQTGTIYNGGWSVCNNGSLAIGGSNIFYQCLSGGFYNLYDQAVAPQCEQVLIDIIPCSGSAVASSAATSAATRSATASVVAQSSDGQVTGASATTVAPPATTKVTQIADGQIQASSAGPKPVSQFSDGQIQVTATPVIVTAVRVSQISDGQIQATSAATRAPVSQISDGQIQATSAATRAPVSQISDGQIQATSLATVATRPATVAQVGNSTATATRAAYTGAANMVSFGAEVVVGAVAAAALLL